MESMTNTAGFKRMRARNKKLKDRYIKLVDGRVMHTKGGRIINISKLENDVQKQTKAMLDSFGQSSNKNDLII